jgi:uncharacterized RDD family membrane protein YckC
VTPGGVGRRFLAFPLDRMLVGLGWLLGTLGFVLVCNAGQGRLTVRSLLLVVGLWLLLGAVLDLVYSVGFVGTCGQTPAMMLLRLRVLTRDGEPVGYARALARWAGFGAVLATLGLGLLVLAFDRDGRGLQDWIAGTRVVRTDP